MTKISRDIAIINCGADYATIRDEVNAIITGYAPTSNPLTKSDASKGLPLPHVLAPSRQTLLDNLSSGTLAKIEYVSKCDYTWFGTTRKYAPTFITIGHSQCTGKDVKANLPGDVSTYSMKIWGGTTLETITQTSTHNIFPASERRDAWSQEVYSAKYMPGYFGDINIYKYGLSGSCMCSSGCGANSTWKVGASDAYESFATQWASYRAYMATQSKSVYVIGALVWLGGNDMSTEERADDYKANLNEMLTSFRSLVGTNFPVIIPKPYPTGVTYQDQVRGDLVSLQAERGDFEIIDIDSCDTLDGQHLSAAGHAVMWPLLRDQVI